MAGGLDTTRCIQAQLWTCLAQTSCILCSGKDGDVQDLAWGCVKSRFERLERRTVASVERATCRGKVHTRFEELLCCRDYFWKFMNGWPELLLQVADAGQSQRMG